MWLRRDAYFPTIHKYTLLTLLPLSSFKLERIAIVTMIYEKNLYLLSNTRTAFYWGHLAGIAPRELSCMLLDFAIVQQHERLKDFHCWALKKRDRWWLKKLWPRTQEYLQQLHDQFYYGTIQSGMEQILTKLQSLGCYSGQLSMDLYKRFSTANTEQKLIFVPVDNYGRPKAYFV